MEISLGTKSFQKKDLPLLKEAQIQTLLHLARGESVLAVLPTGYGKSICFQVPALFWNWKILLVVPILSLIDDHFINLKKMGLEPISLSGTYKKDAENKVQFGTWKVLLTTPEKLSILQKYPFWKKIFLSCSCIVIDEVHCCETWRLFRKSYIKLDTFLKHWDHAPILALTATLNEFSTKKIKGRWKKKIKDIRIPLGRPNLSLELWPLERLELRYLALASILKDLPKNKTAIVYCGSRKKSEKLANFLSSCSWRACSFHAGQTAHYRNSTLKAFQKGHISILCATSAFGMGVNCAHVSKVIHWGPPSSLTGYWQEVGRAGRGSFHAKAILIWSRADIIQMKYFMEEKKKSSLLHYKEEAKAIWDFLFSTDCRQAFIAKHFTLKQEDCGICDNCISKLGKKKKKEELLPWKDPWWLDVCKENKAIREKFFDRS